MSGILLAQRHAFRSGVALPAFGDPFYGGYYAGIVDATKGNIIAADYFQTGSRFAVIVAPKSLETTKAYKTTSDAAPSQSRTRWNGLGATAGMNSSTYPAAFYCAGLTYPTDGASAWYLPAMDELELVFRNLKPATESNLVGSLTATFPGAQGFGYDPSSDPVGAAHTASSPSQTSVPIFQAGGAQALSGSYRTSTESDTTTAWYQNFNTTGFEGRQNVFSKTTSSLLVRPVRRLVLA